MVPIFLSSFYLCLQDIYFSPSFSFFLQLSIFIFITYVDTQSIPVPFGLLFGLSLHYQASATSLLHYIIHQTDNALWIFLFVAPGLMVRGLWNWNTGLKGTQEWEFCYPLILDFYLDCNSLWTNECFVEKRIWIWPILGELQSFGAHWACVEAA